MAQRAGSPPQGPVGEPPPPGPHRQHLASEHQRGPGPCPELRPEGDAGRPGAQAAVREAQPAALGKRGQEEPPPGSVFGPWKAEVPFPGAAACRSLHEQDSATPPAPAGLGTAHPPAAGRNESPRASARRGAPGLGRQPCPRPSASSCVFARSGLVAPLLGPWLPASKQEAASWLRGEALWTGQTGEGKAGPLETRPGLFHGETGQNGLALSLQPGSLPQRVAHIPPAGRTHPPGTHRDSQMLVWGGCSPGTPRGWRPAP